MPFMAFFVSGGIFLLSRPVFMKSGGSYLLHVWFSRPFHKRMSSCFQSSAYASCRYRMDGCINDFITTINFSVMLTYLWIQEMQSFEELCQVMCHHTGMGLCCLMPRPLETYTEIMG